LRHQVNSIAASRTNNDVRTASRNPFIVNLANAINTLLTDQRQERADNAAVAKQIDQAINNISHDLRTPLTVASGYVQYLSEEKLPPAKAQQVLTQAEQNLETVNTRLESLLEYNRITEHRLTVQAENFDLSALVQNALLTLYDALQTAGFTVTPQITSGVLVHLDQEKTRRIIQNLLGNALIHGIKTLHVTLSQHPAAPTITLTVTNGIAHPITHLERLTDRFYTEDLAGQTRLRVIYYPTLSGIDAGTTSINHYSHRLHRHSDPAATDRFNAESTLNRQQPKTCIGGHAQ
jgi:signal transduction histidine kinase